MQEIEIYREIKKCPSPPKRSVNYTVQQPWVVGGLLKSTPHHSPSFTCMARNWPPFAVKIARPHALTLLCSCDIVLHSNAPWLDMTRCTRFKRDSLAQSLVINAIIITVLGFSLCGSHCLCSCTCNCMTKLWYQMVFFNPLICPPLFSTSVFLVNRCAFISNCSPCHGWLLPDGLFVHALCSIGDKYISMVHQMTSIVNDNYKQVVIFLIATINRM